MAEEKKVEEQVVKPKRKIEKPLNPLAQKPGQKYGSTKFEPEKPYKEQLKTDQ
ncbi:hypothetical protein Ga0466249_003465 [Sporomusaceae bacterium BoRhaA]|uniref:hypothetical protein n=1 Tax=Pelorhabdus rhamnosifermentans TaxID=2772457 RepID=UPI001C05FF7E|nr:hypothetical protein [Pelorhabdus rhamnosifermentans]MBU2702338.1 hypothetical protein [Pelorhabdus rhamnosifermentans]